MEIAGVGDVDVVLVLKKSFRVGSPVRVGWTCEVDGDWIGRLSGFDVRMKLLDVHDGDGSEDGDIERGCLKGRWQFPISKNWMEIVRIYSSIVAASLLRVDVPSSSQSIGFGSKLDRVEMDDKVEL